MRGMQERIRHNAFWYGLLVFLLVGGLLFVISCDEESSVSGIDNSDDGSGDDDDDDGGGTTGALWDGTSASGWEGTTPSISGNTVSLDGSGVLYFTEEIDMSGISRAYFHGDLAFQSDNDVRAFNLCVLVYGTSFSGQSWVYYDEYYDMEPASDVTHLVYSSDWEHEGEQIESIKLRFAGGNENEPILLTSPRVIVQ